MPPSPPSPIKPDWLQANAIMLHVPTQILFTVVSLQLLRGTHLITLLDSNKDNPACHRYPLNECDRAGWEHFETLPIKTVIHHGNPLLIKQPRTQLIEVGTGDNRRLEVDEVALAASAIAALFDGEVVPISLDVQTSWGLEPLDD